MRNALHIDVRNELGWIQQKTEWGHTSKEVIAIHIKTEGDEVELDCSWKLERHAVVVEWEV